MKEIIEELTGIRGEACVTITAKSYRTHPDNQKDPIRVKNLIKEAEQRLRADYSAEIANDRISKLQQISSKIDHSLNLDGLLIVVNENTANYYQLPVAMESRVVINVRFAIRDLIRAMQEQSSYYILVLSRRQARLIKAANDHLVEEFTNNFPVINDIVPDNSHETSMASGTDNLIKHFFNKVDKEVQRMLNSDPAPLILDTEERNYSYYTEVMDKQVVSGHLNKNHDNTDAESIVRQAWPVMRNHLLEKNKERLKELKEAVDQQRFLLDLSDIWRAVTEGRGRTVFVKRGYFQPAKIDNNTVTPVDSPVGIDIEDDVVGEIVKRNLRNGGDAVFLSEKELSNFKYLALSTRY